MRRIWIIILVTFLLVGTDAIGQTNKKVPPFQIDQSNGKLFRAQDLPIDKPIIIIYFSPDCEECQEFTEAMLTRMDDFWKASVVMITYLPVLNVAQFVSKYRLHIYPNIFVGTEGNNFIVRYYFNIQRFPIIQ